MFLGRIKAGIAAVGAFLVALGAAYFLGRRDKGAAAEREVMEDEIETYRRVHDADIPADAGAARRWLRERRERGDL